MARSDEIFVVHDVNCLTRVDLAVLPRACIWITVDGDWSTRSRVRLRGRNVTRNSFEPYACGHKTMFADQGRPRRQTVGRRP